MTGVTSQPVITSFLSCGKRSSGMLLVRLFRVTDLQASS